MENAYTSYREVADSIDQQIGSGQLKPGDKLPPLPELAEQYGVARLTAQRAVALLCREGKLQTRPPRGTFVNDRCPLRAIVFVLPSEYSKLLQVRSPTMMDLLTGLQTGCNAWKLPLILATERDDPARYLRVDHGFVFYIGYRGNPVLDDWMRAAAAAKVPMTTVLTDAGQEHFIGKNLAAASRIGVEYLQSLGHRRIQILTRERVEGGPVLPLPDPPPGGDVEIHIHSITYTSQSEYQRASQDHAALDAIFEGPWRPTAIFTGTGAVIHHVLDYCTERGWRVPEDISVLALSEPFWATWAGKQISRVDNPNESLTRECVEQLIKTARGGGYRIGQRLLEPALVPGLTCSTPPSAR